MVGILYLNLHRKYVLFFNTKLALGVATICFLAEPTNYFCLLAPKCNKKISSTPIKYNFRSQRLVKDPGELRAGSLLPLTTNGKVESPKEGTTLILLLFCCFHAMPAKPFNSSHIHCLPLAGLMALSLFCQKVVIPSGNFLCSS